MTDYGQFKKYEWYTDNEKDSDVVVSTRIRLARNLTDYPFSHGLDETGACEITEKVCSVPEFADYEYTDFSKLSVNAATALAERHVVSAEFARKDGKHGLLASPDKGVYIMILEEDHLRIQCLRGGYAIDEAYVGAIEAEEAIDRHTKLAYSERFGYLTHCPTNLGTGMRASVMLFLPAISLAGEIRSLRGQLNKLGLTMRGMNGEGSDSEAYLYQISNQVTLGISEEEILHKLSAVTDSIIKRERELRCNIDGERLFRLRDSVSRAVGIMTHACLMDTGELIELYGKVRLGISLGLTDDMTVQELDRLLFSSMPAGIIAENGDDGISAVDRDKRRAEKIKTALGA